MLLSHRKNGLTSLFKEVRVFKEMGLQGGGANNLQLENLDLLFYACVAVLFIASYHIKTNMLRKEHLRKQRAPHHSPC